MEKTPSAAVMAMVTIDKHPITIDGSDGNLQITAPFPCIGVPNAGCRRKKLINNNRRKKKKKKQTNLFVFSNDAKYESHRTEHRHKDGRLRSSTQRSHLYYQKNLMEREENTILKRTEQRLIGC